jgi:hypothetical protein
MTTAIEKTTGAMTTEQGFQGDRIEMASNTIASVLAAQAKAEIEARYQVAMMRPRNIEMVRTKLKAECDRPGFAECAYYVIKNRGEGLSIRFAESALRAMGNIDARATVIYDDDEKRLMKIEVLDLESNVGIPTMAVIKKTVERKFLQKGEIAISTRVNSYNEVVYTRAATDDEVRPKVNSEISKAIRTAILRLLPGDIQDECKARIIEIRKGAIPTDPSAQRRKIIDSFSSIGVTVELLERYLTHGIDTCSDHELQDLRDLYGNIKAGETTFHAALGDKKEPEPETESKSTKKGIDAITDKIKDAKKGAAERMRVDCIEQARKLWGDADGILKLSEFCRAAKPSFSITTATKQECAWLAIELGDRLAAKEEEKAE